MALGASYWRIRHMIVRESLAPTGVGMAAGIACAVASGRYLESLIVDAHPVDTWTCTAGAGFLLLAGLAAAWSATTRVLAIDPADALRAQ